MSCQDRRWQNKSGIRIMGYFMTIESEEEPGRDKQIKLTLYFEALPRDTTPKTSVRYTGLTIRVYFFLVSRASFQHGHTYSTTPKEITTKARR